MGNLHDDLHQWAWKPNDELKTLKQCLQTLIYCAGGDGNLLFNVGPMPTGQIETRQVERLKEMGAWMEKYGETIYGTRGGPYMPTRTSSPPARAIRSTSTSPGRRSIALPSLPKKSFLSGAADRRQGENRANRSPEYARVPKADHPEIDTIMASQTRRDFRGTSRP